MKFRGKLLTTDMDSIYVQPNIVDLRDEAKSPFRLVQRDYLGFLDYSTAVRMDSPDMMYLYVQAYSNPEENWAMISMPTPRTVFEYICAVNPQAEHMLNNILQDWEQYIGRRPTPKELWYDFKAFCRFHDFHNDEIPF